MPSERSSSQPGSNSVPLHFMTVGYPLLYAPTMLNYYDETCVHNYNDAHDSDKEEGRERGGRC